jgi:hypothetical protein
VHAHGRVRTGQAERLGELAAAEPPALLQPPQRQQFPILRVEPARGLGHVAPLVGQAESQHRDTREVGSEVGGLARHVVRGRARDGAGRAAPVITRLPQRDRRQPGPVGGRVLELGEPSHDPQHRVPHDVVDVRVAAQSPADDVVHQRQRGGDQRVERLPIPLAGGGDQRRIRALTCSGGGHRAPLFRRYGSGKTADRSVVRHGDRVRGAR